MSAEPTKLTWRETVGLFLRQIATPFRCAAGKHEYDSHTVPLRYKGRVGFARQCIHCPHREITTGEDE